MRGVEVRQAEQFKIANKVLKELGRLCASGDQYQARKVHKNSDYKTLTDNQMAWAEKACKMIIERVGLVEGGATDLSTITMADLPSL